MWFEENNAVISNVQEWVRTQSKNFREKGVAKTLEKNGTEANEDYWSDFNTVFKNK